MNRLAVISQIKPSSTILLIVLVLSGLLHGWNMFHFPYFENDEGTYISQAWSLLTSAKLAPYTYWYDHAPAGWIFIATWVKLTGGFFTFGASVNTGRVFMLILHLLSTFFLYSITKKISKSTLAAFIAASVFSITPLGIYFQRRVLLDNIMSFWVLFSLWCLIRPILSLRYIALSSLAFGIAVLSKENAIFFLPGFLYALYLYTDKHLRKFAFIHWLSIAGVLISLYFLYAFMKAELFPVGFFGGNHPHVSLLGTLQEQLSRGNNLPFWNPKSEFLLSMNDWLRKDAAIMLLGIIATCITTILSIRKKEFRIPAVFSLLFWLFLMRGKLVIVFYVVPLLPFLAMNIGISLHKIAEAVSLKRRKAYQVATAFLLLLLVGYFLGSNKEYLIKDETTPQLQTIKWIKDNVPQDAKIVIDDSIYVDLQDKRENGDTIYPYADWAWKIEKDPEISTRSIQNDWKNIEYITVSHELLKQIKDNQFPTTKAAFDNSYLVADFTNTMTSFRDVASYTSTNGDWMSVYRVRDKDTIILESTWSAYKSRYLHSYGQVIDPVTKRTTSPLQGETMLRAAWVGDKESFDGVYAWTNDHMGYRDDALLSREWGTKNGKETLLESNSSSYGDSLIAFALLTAYTKWGKEEYRHDALSIMNDIWKREVRPYGSMYVLYSGTDGADLNRVDTRSIAPAIFRAFADIDKKHPWNDLAHDQYTLLFSLLNANVDQIPSSIELAPNGQIIPQSSTGALSQIIINIALDNVLYKSEDSSLALKALQSSSNEEKLPTQPLLYINDRNKAKEVYKKTLTPIFDSKHNIWGRPSDISLQNTAWFVASLLTNKLPL